MNEWITVSLGEICDKGGGEIKTGPFGSQLHEADYSTVGIPVVMPKDIPSGRVDEATIARIPSDLVRRLPQHVLKEGDIVYGRRGDIGRKALITAREAGWLCGTGCLRITPGEGIVDPRFLFYRLGVPETVAAIAKQAVGATMPNLNTAILRGVKITVPPLATQARIASILGAYDNLIEVNRQRVVLLEDMARGLFDEWFVRFRFPGHEDLAIADTPNGPLPSTWRWEPLASLCDGKAGIQTGPFGSQLHQHDYSQDGVPVVMPKNIANLRIDEREIKRIPEQLARSIDRHLMKEGDIVYGRRGEIGRRAIIPSGSGLWFCGTGSLRFRPEKTKVFPRFLFDALGLPFTEGAIRGRAQGATMPNLSAGVMKDVPVLYPPLQLQKSYASIAIPIYDLATNLHTANERLAASRDFLLPRLTSGQLSVTTAERELLEAA